MSDMKTPKLPPFAPHLVRAAYGWISEAGMTPMIMVDARQPGVEVPQSFVQPNGMIVLNISMSATEHLQLSETEISFAGRFNKVSMAVRVPYWALMSIYSRESSEGQGFGVGQLLPVPDLTTAVPTKPTLGVVIDPGAPVPKSAAPANHREDDPPPPPTEPPSRPASGGKGGHLRVVK